MALLELRQHKGEGIPVKHRVPAILNAPLNGLFQFGETPLHQPALRGPPRQGLEVGNGSARRRRTGVSVGRQLQLPHGCLGCWSVKVLYEYVSYTRSLLALCSQRSPISVEIGIYDTAERSYSGLRVPDPPPSITTLTSRVAPLLNGLFEYFRASPSLGKREVITDVEPAPFTLRVSNIERPKPTAPADAHSQAGQVTIPQFNDFIVAWTHSLKPFRV
jgi:hypothetical protein